MAGGVEFELSIEVLQAFEFKRFRGETILCSGAFNKVSLETPYRRECWFSEVTQGWFNITSLRPTRGIGDCPRIGPDFVGT